jgi:hypothetical protein
MAKNTFSSAFRSLDVDRLTGGGIFDDDDKTTLTSSSTTSSFDVDNVVSLLLSNQQAEALTLCLENAPLFSKDQDKKVTRQWSPIRSPL